VLTAKQHCSSSQRQRQLITRHQYSENVGTGTHSPRLHRHCQLLFRVDDSSEGGYQTTSTGTSTVRYGIPILFVLEFPNSFAVRIFNFAGHFVESSVCPLSVRNTRLRYFPLMSPSKRAIHSSCAACWHVKSVVPSQ
jgi:hypothetical protein